MGIEFLKQHVGKMVQHFKGDFYLIESISRDANTGRYLVNYKALYEDCQLYTRDAEEFLSEIDVEKYSKLEPGARFKPVRIGSVKNDWEAAYKNM